VDYAAGRRLGKVFEIGEVSAGYDLRVPGPDRMDIYECNYEIVFANDVGREVAAR
jgi:hypothetical protein